jgi:hypothetical protein
MRRPIALTLVILFLGVPAFAQGPIMQSATKVVEESLQSPQPGAAGPKRNMLIGGVFLIGAGATMIVLSATVPKCEPSFFGEVCLGETNKRLTYAGAAMVGVGGLLTGLSYLQNVVQVGPLPRGVAVKRTVTF